LIPNYLQPTENVVVMTSGTMFSIDSEKKVIKYSEDQSKQVLGNTIVYIVQ